MRQSLKDLITNTLIFKYRLPNTRAGVPSSKLSNHNDSCYWPSCNESLSKIIYNSVIDYAFNSYQINERDFDVLHRRALTRKLKFSDEATDAQKLKYGFYGEVVLYCMLYVFYGAAPVIARGHLYQILENGETKGYDAYHLVDNAGQSELWFGEVKFFQSFKAATTGTNGAITNLQKAISDDYLNTNLIAISERMNDLATEGSSLKPILEDLMNDPDIKIAELSQKHDIKLIYPMLILFDGKGDDYDKIIKSAIDHIEKESSSLVFDLSIDVSLFFIFLPVDSAKEIKTKVIEWIRDREPLML